MNKIIYNLLVVSVFMLSSPSFANNLQISNLQIVDIDNVNELASIQFDISWENSWRDASNWDAVWVFIKYRIVGETGAWPHANLHSTGHAPAVGTTLEATSDGKGAFLYRNAVGSGTANFLTTKLRWNYGADGLTSTDNVDVEVFAVEMVYVPSGSFYVGDGQTAGGELYGNFEAGTTGGVFQITSEAGFTLGGGGAGSLGNNNATQMFDHPNCSGCLPGSGDDFNDLTTQSLSAAFPKGFNAFYSMKYEMTQQQFVDMLNKSTPAQQSTLTSQNFVLLDGMTLTESRYGISETGGTYSTTEPYIPMIFMDWILAAAYADWAALRPMTELEFEKACRGFTLPVLNEFAWGNANIDLSDNITVNNLSQANEGITAGYDAGGSNGNCWVLASGQNMDNLSRVGVFAAHPSNSGRITSGASIWGIMELSGHAWERAVCVGHSEGRKFTGLYGDGVLSASGHADVANWPGTEAGTLVDSNVGVGYRGGALRFPSPNLERNARVSSRRLAAGYWNNVIRDDGGRLVRRSD